MAKSKKTRKPKRVPVRIINQKTVDMPLESPKIESKPEEKVVREERVQKPAYQEKPVHLGAEMKKIGIIFAAIIAILIILSFVF